MGVRKYVNVIAPPHPTPPHPTPPLRDVTHLQRSMTYVRTCKWTCRGVASWECASTWTLLPHPTPPHPKAYIKISKTLGRFSTRRHKHHHPNGSRWGNQWCRCQMDTHAHCAHRSFPSGVPIGLTKGLVLPQFSGPLWGQWRTHDFFMFFYVAELCFGARRDKRTDEGWAI